MIGKVIYIYDLNRCIYRDGRCIEKEHWEPVVIEGETKVSWVLRHGRKIPKKGVRGVCFTEEERDKEVWLVENRFKISEMVRSLSYDDLRAVAAIVGYQEKEVTP